MMIAKDYAKSLIHTIDRLDFDTLEYIINSIDNSDFVYTCGNGGAATASIHMANDLQKICKKPAMSLASNISLVTAWANDESYDVIFTRQLERIYNPKCKNLLIMFSGSGTSKNIINVSNWALEHNFDVVLITGNRMIRSVNMTVLNVNDIMQRTEDMFMIINHMIAMEFENKWKINTTT